MCHLSPTLLTRSTASLRTQLLLVVLASLKDDLKRKSVPCQLEGQQGCLCHILHLRAADPDVGVGQQPMAKGKASLTSTACTWTNMLPLVYGAMLHMCEPVLSFPEAA